MGGCLSDEWWLNLWLALDLWDWWALLMLARSAVLACG